METASVIKLPIMAAAFDYLADAGQSWNDPIHVTAGDIVEGSGILQYLSPGLALPFRDVITLMIIVSDNTATNMILRQIGIDRVNQFIQGIPLANTRLCKRIDFSLPGPLGLSTAQDLGTLLNRLYQRTLVSPDASTMMWEILCRQQYNTLIAREIPYAWIASESHGPPLVQIGSKGGSLEGIRNDIGIITTPWGDYALALLSEHCADHRFHVDNEALTLLPKISQIIFDYFTQNDRP